MATNSGGRVSKVPGGGDGAGSTPRKPPREVVSEHTRNMRRSALASCYYHATAAPEEHRGAPIHLRPLSLEEAVTYLGEVDRHPQVQQHAAAWLLEAGHPEHRRHVRRLLGDETYNDLMGEIDFATAQRAGAAAPRVTSRSRLGSATPGTAVFEHVHNFFSARRHPGPGTAPCARSNFTLHADMDQDLVTTVTTSVDVNCNCTTEPDKTRYSHLTDPQNWENQGPQFFLNSDRCQLLLPAGMVFTPSPLGVPWWGPLYENVTMSWNPYFPINGQNILNAQLFGPGPSQLSPTDPAHPLVGNRSVEYQMICDLNQCLATNLGASSLSGGIDVDAGTMTVMDLGNGHTRIVATKQARFTERVICGIRLGYWLNAFARFWLAPWMGMLVFGGACAE